jgi:hypothetical protein
MELIVTPTAKWIEDACAACHHSIDIASPFVGSILPDMIRSIPARVSKSLLTRTRLQDFAAGASNLEAVISAARAGFTVSGLDDLHAKVYVFDRRLALVTSANATFSGLKRNAECGICFDEAPLVEELIAKIRAGFRALPPPTPWTASQLAALVPAVERIRQRLPERTRVKLLEGEAAAEFELSKREAEGLLISTAQWTQLVFRGILRLGKQQFNTDEVVDSCVSEIRRKFPRNRHPREKVRQQLQRLRDLGLLQFLLPGNYRLVPQLTG